MQIDEASNGQHVEVEAGEALEIRLGEDPTTGFRWAIVSGGEPVCVLEQDAFEAGSGAPGTAGSHVWRFRTVREGTGVIELGYRRPWETEDSPGRVFRATVRVSAG